MNFIPRYLEKPVLEDLNKKMVFIAGPRQCGKTTFSKKLLAKTKPSLTQSYFNWDFGKDRESIIKENFPPGKGLLILDEIHKYTRWRQVVKGLYDKRNEELKILVTGSGKLDYYRHGGDSLQGRYHFYRLHPFSLAEIPNATQKTLLDLFQYTGFPEPYLLRSERELKRWSAEYRSRIINDDLNSLENVKDIALVENLSYRLPDLVGSPLSINSLKYDLQVSHQTVSRWIDLLEKVYMIFRIYPFGAPKIHAVKKEAKHYHFDWNLIEDEGKRFENMMACHLLKWCHFIKDYYGDETELRYFRDIEKREVDFVILRNRKPFYFIECKLKNKEINKTLKYLKNRFANAKALQISLHDSDDYVNRDGIQVTSAYRFLSTLI